MAPSSGQFFCGYPEDGGIDFVWNIAKCVLT